MRVEYDEQTDDWLLQQFVLSRNQEAFAVLVRRYGPMVWGVCRRIVRHTQDAEDALQATFAVLARKARSIRRQRTIGGWLYQVARRISLRARANSNRRNAVMSVTAKIATVDSAVDQSVDNPTEVLDDEIARLPTALRLPIILCYLQGLTNREAAERLGCPEGTIVSRLARAREKLRQCLTRRGVVVAGTATLAVMLAEVASAAPLPPDLMRVALVCGQLPETGSISGGSLLTSGAERLASKALHDMRSRSLAAAAATIVCCALGISVAASFFLPSLNGGVRAQNRALGQPENWANVPLAGIWQGEDIEFLGGATAEEHTAFSRDCRWVILGNTIRFKWKDVTVFSADFETDPSSKPTAIDIRPDGLATIPDGEVLRGVFKRDLISLEVCTAQIRGSRPGSVRAGVVARPADESPEVRAGLVGYSRLRWLNRSFEVEEIQGKWVLEQMEIDGKAQELDPQRREGALFDNDKYTLYRVDGDKVTPLNGTFSLDFPQPSRFMQLGPFQCLYEIEGDTLRLVAAAPGSARPTEFKTEEGQKHVSWVFRRPKP